MHFNLFCIFCTNLFKTVAPTSVYWGAISNLWSWIVLIVAACSVPGEELMQEGSVGLREPEEALSCSHNFARSSEGESSV